MMNIVKKYINEKISRTEFLYSMNSYIGWCKYCNSKHLLQKIEDLTNEHFNNWKGKLSKISLFYFKRITVYDIKVNKSTFFIYFTNNFKSYKVKSKNRTLLSEIIKYETPFEYIIYPRDYFFC